MKLKIYQVDAFAAGVFKGNPAAVIPLTEWLSDVMLLNIAAENNLSETAFFVPRAEAFEIRWFTPDVEVDLCGHATLASAFVISNFEGFENKVINFISPRSGALTVYVEADQLVLDFPVDTFEQVPLTEELMNLTDKKSIAAFKGKTDYMLVYEQQDEIQRMKPNLVEIAKLEARGLIVTAKGAECDFVSRFFGPAVGVDEDPVTGSAHTTLTPYWTEKLGKKNLKALQLSKRGGEIDCEAVGDRVKLTGKAVLYMKGEIYI